jgi:hypothetical protein
VIGGNIFIPLFQDKKIMLRTGDGGKEQQYNKQ